MWKRKRTAAESIPIDNDPGPTALASRILRGLIAILLVIASLLVAGLLVLLL
jgi:hypothetical protein